MSTWAVMVNREFTLPTLIVWPQGVCGIRGLMFPILFAVHQGQRF